MILLTKIKNQHIVPRKSTYLLLLILLFGKLYGQEIHFSQINNQPLLVNPAQAGLFEGSLRLMAGYRNQGASISVPYTTYTAGADAHLEPKGLNHSAIGLGLNMYNDNAGEGSLRTTSGYFTASFIRGFDQEDHFKAALGFSVGIINRSINFSQLVFDSQWNGTIFDPDVASHEPYTSNSLFAPDFGFCGMISWKMNERFILKTGAAMNHLNRPKLTFYEAENRLEPKLTVHALAEMKINELLVISPGIFYAGQQDADELMLGSGFSVTHENMQFITGLWYRWERDLVPQVGFLYNDLLIEFSYDVNISKLHIASNYRGGLEVSIVKILNYQNRNMRCYEF